ncbi:MAG: TetR/AcrR family transcriptional regulator [Devosia sp.]
MPYSAQHKLNTRNRIVTAARKHFNRDGFEAVSIEAIMREAGLTHGGFYKHFARKEELYAEAVLEFICKTQPDRWQKKHVDPKVRGPELARMILDAYLSDDHLRDRDASCPMIALPSDVQRGNRAVKAAFREVLEMMAGAFAGNLADDGRSVRERSLAMVAMAVGGMVLARSVDDRALGREIRQAARAEAYRSSGWELDPPAVAAE